MRAPTGEGLFVDDEVAYMRGWFKHFVGSRDSSLYMVAPAGWWHRHEAGCLLQQTLN